MATSVAIATTVHVTPGARREVSAVRAYRLRESLAAVHFDAAGKGRIVFLPEGADLRVIGPSSLCGCLEVLCQNRLHNVFKADLLGPKSVPIESNPRESIRIDTGRIIVASGARA
jgi:hypothetical protein